MPSLPVPVHSSYWDQSPRGCGQEQRKPQAASPQKSYTDTHTHFKLNPYNFRAGGDAEGSDWRDLSILSLRPGARPFLGTRG